MSVVPSTPQPTGNIADLANNLNLMTAANASTINIFSSLIGTLADSFGVIGTVVSVAEEVVSLFNPNQKQDAYLEEVLNQINQYFNQLYQDFNSRFNQFIWINLSELVSDSEAVVQSLPTLLTEQPPPTDDFRVSQVEACLSPVDALSDTSLRWEGNFFLSTYSSMTYWTDAGLYIAYFPPIDLDDGSDGDGQDPEWTPIDVGYGLQAPPQPDDGQIFSYIYVLPYCIKAYTALIATGTSLYPDFGTNTQWQTALISFAQFLTTIHNAIAGGITKLIPPDPSSQDWWGNSGPNGDGVTGIIGNFAETSDSPPPYLLSSVTFELGAVEIYSGYSSINNSLGIQGLDTAWPNETPIYQKLQVRALREMINVYNGVGLLSVWSVINNLNQLTQTSPLPLYKFAAWSFQEIFGQAGVSAQSDGFLHLSDLATLLAQTPPLDTAQTGPPFSFRGLLEPS